MVYDTRPSHQVNTKRNETRCIISYAPAEEAWHRTVSGRAAGQPCAHARSHSISARTWVQCVQPRSQAPLARCRSVLLSGTSHERRRTDRSVKIVGSKSTGRRRKFHLDLSSKHRRAINPLKAKSHEYTRHSSPPPTRGIYHQHKKTN